ncbi:hypothetical protein ARMSODRAFT_1019585 [Armillaria solidipes]|uniref:Uncharacterized protein n=1 Tax=Armillaria solidipes TaxID=1076256 RepID=A0A2H3BX31_9AGAR|nr:hypothetical protein ARMSODRAFT_1019585 [Armillaria solidipes]
MAELEGEREAEYAHLHYAQEHRSTRSGNDLDSCEGADTLFRRGASRGDQGRGMRVLFESAFCNMYLPIQFLCLMRYTEPPCKIKDMSEVDVVAVSLNI